MACGDLCVNQHHFLSRFVDRVCDSSDKFNANSGGTIIFDSEFMGGYVADECYWNDTQSFVFDRDTCGTEPVAKNRYDQSRIKCVKLSHRVGPIEMRPEDVKKQGVCGGGGTDNTNEILSQVYGWQAGLHVQRKRLTNALGMLVAGLSGVPALVIDDGAVGGTPGEAAPWSEELLNIAKAQFGENESLLRAAVMPSAVRSWRRQHLMGRNNGFNFPGVNLISTEIGGTTMGGVITDNVALQGPPTANGNPTYYVLLLQPGAATVTDAEEQTVKSVDVLCEENISTIIQGEGATKYEMRGLSWNGPDIISASSDLSSPANWAQAYSGICNLPGVLLHVRAPCETNPLTCVDPGGV